MSKDAKPSPPTIDALIESLIAAKGNSDAPGLTSAEIAQQRGWSRSRVMEALRQLGAQGRLVPTPVYRPAIDGTMRRTTVYSVREKGKR